jgi:hypothetical protein
MNQQLRALAQNLLDIALMTQHRVTFEQTYFLINLVVS